MLDYLHWSMLCCVVLSMCVSLSLKVVYKMNLCFSWLLHNVYLRDVLCGIVTMATAKLSFQIYLFFL